MDKKICYTCFKEVEQDAQVCPYCKAKLNEENTPPTLPVGTILGGRYIVGKALGQGGFGITYIAEDYNDKTIVALKEFFPEAMANRIDQLTVSSYTGERGESFLYGKECFIDEAKTLSEFIGDPGIVRVLSYFEENNTAYFAMEYIKGRTLSDYLNSKGGKISYDEAKEIIIPVMDALSNVHSKGIIHRDISPDNIIITDSGAVKLIDFGAARYSLGDRSRSLDVVLKHGYAPREQYSRRGKQGPFTDVYAVAATFYRAITGRIPPDSIDRIDDDALVAPSTLGVKIPAPAEDALIKALSVQPEDRFRSMTEFKAALNAEKTVAIPDRQTKTAADPAIVNAQTQPIQPTVPERTNQNNTPPAPAKNNLWLMIAAGIGAAAMVFLAGFGVMNLISGSSSPAPAATESKVVSDPDSGSGNSSGKELTSSSKLNTVSKAAPKPTQAPKPTEAPTEEPDNSLGERVDFTFFSIEVPDGMIYEENDNTGAITFYDEYNYNLHKEYHMGVIFTIMPFDSESQIENLPHGKKLGKSKGYSLAAILPTDVQWETNDPESDESYHEFYDIYEDILDTIELK